MNKIDAIQAMLNGHTVTHRYFDNDEHVAMRKYQDEKGCTKIDSKIYVLSSKHEVSEIMFWHDRSGAHWNEGWEVYK